MANLNLDLNFPVEQVIPISSLIENPEIGAELITYLKENNTEILRQLFRQTDGTVVIRYSLILPLLNKYLDWLKDKQLKAIADKFKNDKSVSMTTYSLPANFTIKEDIRETLEYALTLVDYSCLESIAFRQENGLNFIKAIARHYQNQAEAMRKLKKEADEYYAECTIGWTAGGGDRPA